MAADTTSHALPPWQGSEVSWARGVKLPSIHQLGLLPITPPCSPMDQAFGSHLTVPPSRYFTEETNTHGLSRASGQTPPRFLAPSHDKPSSRAYEFGPKDTLNIHISNATPQLPPLRNVMGYASPPPPPYVAPPAYKRHPSPRSYATPPSSAGKLTPPPQYGYAVYGSYFEQANNWPPTSLSPYASLPSPSLLPHGATWQPPSDCSLSLPSLYSASSAPRIQNEADLARSLSGPARRFDRRGGNIKNRSRYHPYDHSSQSTRRSPSLDQGHELAWHDDHPTTSRKKRNPPRVKKQNEPYRFVNDCFSRYHIVDLGLSWEKTRQRYAQFFPKEQWRVERSDGGLQCAYYRTNGRLPVITADGLLVLVGREQKEQQKGKQKGQQPDKFAYKGVVYEHEGIKVREHKISLAEIFPEELVDEKNTWVLPEHRENTAIKAAAEKRRRQREEWLAAHPES